MCEEEEVEKGRRRGNVLEGETEMGRRRGNV
jgi:hypothetical protein